MKNQLTIFFTAVSFYTRLPVPKKYYEHNNVNKSLNDALRYLPIIGWIVGLIAGGVYLICFQLFDQQISLLFSMAASVLTTGAFHEDGFADACDGFGGGWIKEKILSIMKDSRLGTYGTLGLLFILLFKFFALDQLIALTTLNSAKWVILLTFIITHSLSRFAALAIIFRLDYISSADSKSANAISSAGKTNFYLALLFTLMPIVILIILANAWSTLFVLIAPLLIVLYSTGYFKKWLGGYTGDCLGAVQQVAEVFIYLSFILVWKYTL